MNCPICRSKFKIFCKEKSFKIYKCINCGFGLTADLKIESEDYHRDNSYIEEEKLFRNIFLKRVNNISKFLKAGKVLEIGCSTGIFLSLLKEKGFEVKGIELSKKAAEVAKSRGIEVEVNYFEKSQENQKYDLIIFNHTLEHIPDFKLALYKAKKLLKPKGLIYIDLPNFGSLTAKLLKAKWSLLLPKEHHSHFTQKALNILLKGLDFKILSVNKASGIWDYQNPFKGLINSLFGFKKRFFNEALTALPALFVTTINQGSGLTVIARKK